MRLWIFVKHDLSVCQLDLSILTQDMNVTTLSDDFKEKMSDKVCEVCLI